MTSVVEADRTEEAWVQSAHADHAIRVRNLTALRSKGVTIVAARLLEQLDEIWTIWIRLSDRAGEFRVNLAKSDEPRTYSDVALAILAIRKEFGFYGDISVSTERRPEPAEAET